MKKPGLIVFLLLILANFFSLRITTFAQEESSTAGKEFNYDRAYQDYIYNYNLYLEAHKEYVVAKNQYETYQTLTSKTIALEQTTKMLQARDEVLATFLTAFRINFAEVTNVATGKLNLLYLQLDKEVEWFRDHKETLTSAGSIPDLINLSNQAQNRYQKTQALVYRSLLEKYFYKEGALHDQLEELIIQVDEKITLIREDGEIDTATIERWLLEAKNRKTRGEEKLAEAQNYEIRDSYKNEKKLQIFNRSVSLIEESHQYLKEANKALIEIIKEIKRGD